MNDILYEAKCILRRKPTASINTIAQILASKYKNRLAKGNYEKALQKVQDMFFDNFKYLTEV